MVDGVGLDIGSAVAQRTQKLGLDIETTIGSNPGGDQHPCLLISLALAAGIPLDHAADGIADTACSRRRVLWYQVLSTAAGAPSMGQHSSHSTVSMLFFVRTIFARDCLAFCATVLG